MAGFAILRCRWPQYRLLFFQAKRRPRRVNTKIVFGKHVSWGEHCMAAIAVDFRFHNDRIYHLRQTWRPQRSSSFSAIPSPTGTLSSNWCIRRSTAAWKTLRRLHQRRRRVRRRRGGVLRHLDHDLAAPDLVPGYIWRNQ